MSGRERRLLILGGTGEAVALAELVARDLPGAVQVITSLAGRTENPRLPPGEVRVGGFGGPEGLVAYLRDEAIDLVVDATHPFATGIAAAADAACAAASVPRLRLGRPEWQAGAGDRWIDVANAGEAAAMLPGIGRRAFLTTGGRSLPPFTGVRGVWFLVRMIDPPKAPLPLESYEVTIARGPFTLAGERDLLSRHAIDVLITKASGGPATEAKLAAAREAGIPVILLRRPPSATGPRVESVEAALDWVRARLQAGSSASGRQT